jgi:hypothetical protein
MERSANRSVLMRYLIVAAVVGLIATGCGAAPVETPSSCGELRAAWEAAGGPDANYAMQVRTVERANQLGASSVSRDDAVTCDVLFDEAYLAASCSAPDVPPAFRSCSGG